MPFLVKHCMWLTVGCVGLLLLYIVLPSSDPEYADDSPSLNPKIKPLHPMSGRKPVLPDLGGNHGSDPGGGEVVLDHGAAKDNADVGNANIDSDVADVNVNNVVDNVDNDAANGNVRNDVGNMDNNHDVANENVQGDFGNGNANTDASRKHDAIQMTIPHVIHQMWHSYEVPEQFVPWIKSWIQQNPNFEYWFWTPNDIRQVVQERHHSLYLKMLDDYKQEVMKIEVGRYFVLHDLGGFYVDIDLECLRPLQKWVTEKHQCVVSNQNFAHSHVLTEAKRVHVSNSFLACRPKHPFIHMVVAALPDLIKQYPDSHNEATGAYFLDGIRQSYRNLPKDMIDSLEYNMTVLHPDHFLYTYDPEQMDSLKIKCESILQNPETQTEIQDVCRQLAARQYSNHPPEWAYARHHWAHTISKAEEFRGTRTVSIFDVVPNVRTYSRSVKLLHRDT